MTREPARAVGAGAVRLCRGGPGRRSVELDPDQEVVVEIVELVRSVEEAATVRRVFGDPIVGAGVTVVPVAAVAGGGGGGGGQDAAGQEGSGGGFGVRARPVGVYVLRDGEVRWFPAVDPSRVAAYALAAAVVLAFARPRATGRRRRPA